MTVAELEMGVLAATGSETRARRLQTLRAAESSEPLPVTRAVARRFAALAVEMRGRGQGRLKVQDAWIAATALAHDAELWTQDEDFAAVPGLTVVSL